MKNWWQTTFPDGLQKLSIRDSNGTQVQIAYGEKGTGKPIVLMHGWGVWSYSWTHVITKLSQQFRVICFDYKGFGYSDKPPQANKIGYQIEETERVLEALGASQQPINLVAESLGTVIALAVAQRRPELIASLILLDAAIFPTKMPHWSMHAMIYTPSLLIRRIDQLRLINWIAPLLRFFIRTGAGAIYHNIPADIAERAYHSLQPYLEFPHTLAYLFTDSKAYAQQIRAFLQGNPSLLGAIQAELGKINTPCLILWGEQDRWFPVSDAKRLARTLPNAQLIIQAGCGHHLSGDCPDAVIQHIQAFLQKNKE